MAQHSGALPLTSSKKAAFPFSLKTKAHSWFLHLAGSLMVSAVFPWNWPSVYVGEEADADGIVLVEGVYEGTSLRAG